jgi:hypothetical protein
MRVFAIDSALEELDCVDAASLSDDELHELVVFEQALTSRLAAIRAVHAGEWESRRVWDSDGSKAGWARLARECSLSEATAKAEVRRAKRLRSMPATTVAFGEGKLTVDQVDVLTAVYEPAISDMFARDEGMLIDDVVRPNRVADATRLIEYWKQGAFDAIGAEPELFNPQGRHWTAVRGYRGGVEAAGRLDPVAGTEYLEELESIEQELFEADWAAARAEHGEGALPAQLPRTATQRRADAQVQMARNSRACRQGRFHQPRPLLTVHVGLGALARMCELADGTVVSPTQVFPLLTEADLERIVFDGPSRVIEVGVRQRFFTGALRRAIEVRDRHCQHESGCDVPAERCHIDHKVRYADGGLTTQDNGRCYCATHNRQREHRPDHQRPPP